MLWTGKREKIVKDKTNTVVQALNVTYFIFQKNSQLLPEVIATLHLENNAKATQLQPVLPEFVQNCL